jgi:cytidine deaminase
MPVSKLRNGLVPKSVYNGAMTNSELRDKAASVIRPVRLGEFITGNVGCALITDSGNVYTGVCIETSSGMGFCGEHNAIGSMITAGEYRITRIVAVVRDENGDVFVLSPCGRCREFMRQINEQNLEIDVLFDIDKVIKLKELLPYYDWYHRVTQ